MRAPLAGVDTQASNDIEGGDMKCLLLVSVWVAAPDTSRPDEPFPLLWGSKSGNHPSDRSPVCEHSIGRFGRDSCILPSPMTTAAMRSLNRSVIDLVRLSHVGARSSVLLSIALASERAMQRARSNCMYARRRSTSAFSRST